MVQIGVNPIMWSNDDLRELGKDITLETCLSQASAAGYAGIELGHKFPRDAEILGPVLEKHQLRLVSGWYSSYLLQRSVDEEITAAKQHLDLLSAMSCNVVVWAECTGAIHGDLSRPLSKRPKLDATEWKEFGRKLTAIADMVTDKGLAFAYHHHMGTVIQNEAEIDKLMSVTGSSVSLLLDTGHLTYAGGSPIGTIEKHGNRISHFHAKDVRKDVAQISVDQDHSFLQAVVDGIFTVPGDGNIKFEPLLRQLSKLGYSGWLVVEAEQNPKVADPAEYSMRGFEHLSNLTRFTGMQDKIRRHGQ